MYYKPENKAKERILTIRVSADLVESIDKVAKKLGLTRSKLIKKAMERALEELTKESPDDISRATALMSQGKHIKHSPEEWKKIERKLEDSDPAHKTLKEAMKFIRGRDKVERQTFHR